MDILETLGFSGEKIPQDYGQGIPKDEIKAQKEQQERIKYLNDLQETCKKLKQQLDTVNWQLDTTNKTNKQKDEKINTLEKALATKDFDYTTLVNSILPYLKSLEKSVEALRNINSSQKITIDSQSSLIGKQNEKIDRLEEKIDAVVVKNEAIHVMIRTIPIEIITEMSKISNNQISEIAQLPLSEEASDEIDAIVRTRLGETVDVTSTKIVSEMSKIALNMQVPTPAIDLSKIEEKIEEISDGTTYLVEETDGKIDNIKEVVEALKLGVPSTIVSTPTSTISTETNETDIDLSETDIDIDKTGETNETDIDLSETETERAETPDCIDKDIETEIGETDETDIDLSGHKKAFLDYLTEPKSPEEIMSKINISKATTYRYIKELKKEGLIRHKDGKYMKK